MTTPTQPTGGANEPVVRRLSADDATAFQELRLFGLRESSSAYAASYEEEVDLPLAEVAARLVRPDSAVFGAFADGLVGTAGVYRQPHRKMRHRAHLWGVYVHPAARRRGVGLALMREALRFAEHDLEVRYLTLAVNLANQAAITLYQSCGFTNIGVERDLLLIDGVFHDDLRMVCDLRRSRDLA